MQTTRLANDSTRLIFRSMRPGKFNKGNFVSFLGPCKPAKQGQSMAVEKSDWHPVAGDEILPLFRFSPTERAKIKKEGGKH